MAEFINDIDLAIEELRSLKTLAQLTMADLEQMRIHQDFAFELGESDYADDAKPVMRQQHTLAGNRLAAAREKLKHFYGTLGAVEHHMMPSLAPAPRYEEADL